VERDVEAALIVRCKAGDKAALAELIRAHQGPLYCFLVRMTSRPQVAEDVAQEAMYRALKHLDRYDDRWRFSTWLFTIARRVYWNMRERKSPKFDSDGLDAAPHVEPVWAITGWTTERNDEQVWQRDKLQQALARLTEAQREVLVLFHQQGWSITTIAQSLGMAEGTVKSHLFRARARLREDLDTTFHPDAAPTRTNTAHDTRRHQGDRETKA
jgi:RNA polymerase sigma-70 factor, ECF subfamily